MTDSITRRKEKTRQRWRVFEGAKRLGENGVGLVFFGDVPVEQIDGIGEIDEEIARGYNLVAAHAMFDEATESSELGFVCSASLRVLFAVCLDDELARYPVHVRAEKFLFANDEHLFL